MVGTMQAMLIGGASPDFLELLLKRIGSSFRSDYNTLFVIGCQVLFFIISDERTNKVLKVTRYRISFG